MQRSTSAVQLPSMVDLITDEAKSKGNKSQRPSITIDNNEDRCPICLMPFLRNIAMFTTQCGHAFHYECIYGYVNHEQYKKKCPTCRQTQNLAQWIEFASTEVYPYCVACGRRSSGGKYCEDCGEPLTHTPPPSPVRLPQVRIVACPTCLAHCRVSTPALIGFAQRRRTTYTTCPNGHFFNADAIPQFWSVDSEEAARLERLR